MRKLIAIAALALMMVPALAQNHTDYTLPQQPKRAKYVDYPSQDKGFWFAVQATGVVLVGLDIPVPTTSVDLIAGYRFGEFFKVGAGISPGFFWMGAFNMPVYLDLRGNIISQESRMVVPYWSLDTGYNVGQPTGFMVSPTIGVRVGMPRNNFIAGVTYFLQTQPNNSVLHTGEINLYNSIGIRLGYEF